MTADGGPSDLGAVGSVRVPASLGVAKRDGAVVLQRVVVAATRSAVADVGEPAAGEGYEVVGFAVVAGYSAPDVGAEHGGCEHGFALGAGEEALAAAHVEHDAVGGEHLAANLSDQ